MKINFVKLYITVLLLSVLFFITGIVSYAVDSIPSYTIIDVGNSSVSIVAPRAVQYFSFTPAKTGSYKLQSYGTYDTFCVVYDSEMRWMNEADDTDYDGGLKNFTLLQDFYAGQTYYFAISFSDDGDNSDSVGGFPIELTRQNYISNTISPVHISLLNNKLSQTSYTYDGKPKFPVVTITDGSRTLTENTDYTISYYNESKSGTAYARVYGIGKYYGYTDLTYTINKGKLSSKGITLSKSSFKYNGKERNPEVSFEQNGELFFEGIDYTVSYKNNINAGTATVYVKATGTCDYKGTVYKTYTIKPASVSDEDTSLEDDTYTYTGKTILPAVYIGNKKINKKNYTLSYIKGGKSTGSAILTIVFKRNYTGTVNQSFKIVPKKVKKSKIKVKNRKTTSYTITWKKAGGATGYRIYLTDPETEEVSYINTKKTSYKVKSDDGIVTKIRIRAYKKIGKKFYLGEGITYSDVTKPKKPTKPEYEYDAEKETLKLTLDRDDLNYNIQMADNKKLDKKTKYEGKGDVASIPISKDTKTIYLRVRYNIKNSKKKVIYSKWTKVYKIKLS